MFKLSRLWATLVAVAALAAPCTVFAKDAPEPVTFDGSKPAAELAPQLVEITDAALLKGLSKVAIPLFSVQFITGDNVSAETSGFASAGRARSSAYHSLVGVGEPEFQALTEGLYQALVKALTAQGLEVVPMDTVLASPTWRKLAAAGAPSPLRNEGSIVVAPQGMAIYGANKITAGGGSNNKPGLFGSLSALGDVASTIGAATDTPALQQELGGATLLEANLRVHFVKLTNGNKGFLGRLSSTAEVSSKSYPSITSASLAVRTAHSGTTLSLKQPLALDPSAFREVREEAKSGGEVAGAIVGSLIRMAIGNKDSDSSARFQTVADPQRYQEVVGSGLNAVGEMFVARIGATR